MRPALLSQPLKASLLTREESLRLSAFRTLATRAAQSHLRRGCLVLLKMCLGNIGESSDEYRASVQALNTFDGIGMTAFSNDFLIELEKGLNVVGSKCDRDKD